MRRTQRGADTAALVFAYTVAAGDFDPDGVSWAANALELDGGTIRLLTDDTISPDLEHGPKAEGSGAAGGRGRPRWSWR